MSSRTQREGRRIHGRPRSLAEMDFVAGMHPCDACGSWEPATWRTGGSGDVWTVRANCPRCDAERMYVFSSSEDLTEAEHPDLELGGPEPSEVLDPYALMRELDRIAPMVSSRGADLVGPARERNWDLLERAQTALHELAKFVPVGAAEIPERAQRGEDALADRRARPERYTRAWIEQELAHWAGVEKQLVASRPAVSVVPVRRGVLDRETADAHRRWVIGGRRGEGGLDVVGFDASGARLDGEKILGARLEAVNLQGANVSYTDISHGVITACDFTQAQLSSLKLMGATVERCTFRYTRATLIDFKQATVRDCAFDGSDLDRSRWAEATCERTSFRKVSFGNSQLDDGRFTGCDFREARFCPASSQPRMSMVGVVFDSCDFRDADFTGADLTGATFRGCKLGGAHGTPKAAVNVTVLDADFSEAGDRSDLGGLEDLLEELR